MNCENCGAPMRPVEGRHYLACGYCHTFHFPTELDASADRITPLFEPAGVECPVCSEPLHLGTLEATRALYCDRCRGILIPNEAFGQVVQYRRSQYGGADASPTPIDTRQYERRLKCPQCSGRMEVHPYHGPGNVVIDSCAACRLIWLDHGELGAIERAPGRRRSAAAEPRQNSIRPAATPTAEDNPIDVFDLLFG